MSKDFCKNLNPRLSAVSNDKLVAIESINECLYHYGIIAKNLHEQASKLRIQLHVEHQEMKAYYFND
ncbi:25820_t:CDS:2, partial [Gigaspora rosea]